LPLGIFEVFAKAGWLFYDVNVDVGDADASDNGNDVVYGAGVGVNLFEHLNVKLEYEEIDIENTDDSNALFAFWASDAGCMAARITAQTETWLAQCGQVAVEFMECA